MHFINSIRLGKKKQVIWREYFPYIRAEMLSAPVVFREMDGHRFWGLNFRAFGCIVKKRDIIMKGKDVFYV